MLCEHQYVLKVFARGKSDANNWLLLLESAPNGDLKTYFEKSLKKDYFNPYAVNPK
jgi:hypothetical protein